MSRLFLFLSVLLCTFLFAFAAPAAPTLPTVSLSSHGWTQSEVQRKIDLKTHVEEVNLNIKLTNDGKSHASSYLLSIPSSKSSKLSYAEGSYSVGKSKDKKNLISRPVKIQSSEMKSFNVEEKTTFVEFQFPSSVAPGESVTLTLLVIFTTTQKPFPEQIQQADNQLVLWQDSKVFFSPYATENQNTIIKLASSQVESYTKKGGKVRGDEVAYSDVKSTAAFTFTPIQIHFQNNSPFATLTNFQKDIEVSHWGNVAIQDNYLLLHTGAKLVGPYSRVDYDRYPNQAPAAFEKLVATLPRTATDIYYRDYIGNISTSHVRKTYAATVMEIEPRYPMFGGWQADFNIGYNLPSQNYLSVSKDDPDVYVLNITFGSPFPTVDINELAVRVILPEGAHEIQWQTPFDVDSEEYTEYKTYLDTTGRPTLILRKLNAVKQHAQLFQVSYRFAKASILREPGLVAAAFFLFFAVSIFFFRADLRITDDADDEETAKKCPYTSTRTSTHIPTILNQTYVALYLLESRSTQQQTKASQTLAYVKSLLQEVSQDSQLTGVAQALDQALAQAVNASRKYIQGSAIDTEAKEAFADAINQAHDALEKLAKA